MYVRMIIVPYINIDMLKTSYELMRAMYIMHNIIPITTGVVVHNIHTASYNIIFYIACIIHVYVVLLRTVYTSSCFTRHHTIMYNVRKTNRIIYHTRVNINI